MFNNSYENDNPNSKWIIVYPRGDRNQLSVVEISNGLEYEISDYAVASRREFYADRKGAEEYAAELAGRHGKRYDGKPDYLD